MTRGPQRGGPDDLSDLARGQTYTTLTDADSILPLVKPGLPCPFCGSYRARDMVVPGTNGGRRFVRCMNCSAQGPWSDKSYTAIDYWNKRP